MPKTANKGREGLPVDEVLAADKEDQDRLHDHTETDPNKPSNIFHGDKYVVRCYCDEGNDPQVYVRVKHVWFKNKGKVMIILHYFPDGSYRYVCRDLKRIVWYQITPERFEQQNLENEMKVDR